MDRNVRPPAGPHVAHGSLSARRAWIEIRLFVWIAKRALVALRKESVDRNKQIIDIKAIDKRRSPQGERG